VNKLEGLDPLKNRYVVMRHGHSRPNAARMVVSDPASGRQADAGLTERGQAQVMQTLTDQPHALGPTTRIVCSDFARALQSAAIISGGLGTTSVQVDPRLGERWFGLLEGGPDDAYRIIWAADAADGAHHLLGVESAEQVLDRATGLVADLESHHRDETFLLISHGDVLQILQCGFAAVRPGWHRIMAPLATAEMRDLSRIPISGSIPARRPGP
jgi:probable phosphoglycerate mutase